MRRQKMKNIFLIAVLIFLVSGCDQMSREGYLGKEKNNTLSNVNKPDAGIQGQDEKKQFAIPEPDFSTEIDQAAAGKKGRERSNSDKDAGEIINEVERIICEGDCSSYVMANNP